jgi:hypothetical protein
MTRDKELLMFSPKIRIDKALHDRLAQAAERAGYASVGEFIVHVLEREAARIEEAGTDEEVERQLRGLGYIE